MVFSWLKFILVLYRTGHMGGWLPTRIYSTNCERVFILLVLMRFDQDDAGKGGCLSRG
jgi:hypothetical protein